MNESWHLGLHGVQASGFHASGLRVSRPLFFGTRGVRVQGQWVDSQLSGVLDIPPA